jgi:hypothetical protein
VNISKHNYGNQGDHRRPAKITYRGTTANGPVNEDRELVAYGTLMRTKNLLLAALRVWELKQPEQN